MHTVYRFLFITTVFIICVAARTIVNNQSTCIINKRWSLPGQQSIVSYGHRLMSVHASWCVHYGQTVQVKH